MSELRDPPASDDFEWVNAWAHGVPPAAGAEPKPEPAPNAGSASGLAEWPVQNEAVAAASAPAAETQSRDAIAPHPTDIVASQPPVTAKPDFAERVAQVSRKRALDAEQFVHPATRRFFAALRTPTARREAPAAIDAPMPAHRAEPIAQTVSASPVVESADASLAPEASRLERDIADIECARDALVDPAPAPINDSRTMRRRFSALRHAEAVPILVGSVVGATLLLVFGAAASLISLR